MSEEMKMRSTGKINMPKKFLFIVLVILKTNGIFSQDNSINFSFQENPLYNTLYGTDCSIPRGVRFVHYPMLHPSQLYMAPFWKKLFRGGEAEESFIDHETAYSSFLFIQLIKQNPSSVVFDEMLIGREEAVLYRNLRWQYQYMTYGAPIAQRFFPDIYERYSGLMDVLWRIKNAGSYEQLGPKEINILSRSTGAAAAYILGLLNRLYPVTFLSDIEFADIYFSSNGFNSFDSFWYDRKIFVNHLISLTNRFNNSDDEAEKEEIKQDFYFYYKELTRLLRQLSYYMLQWREQAAVDFAVNAVRKTRKRRFFNKPAVIAFGAAHDFTDNFAGKSFYTLPLSCALLPDSPKTLLQIAVVRYLAEESELNQEILRQFIKNQWSRMSLDQKSEIDQTYQNHTGSAVFVPISEILRRIFKGESVSDEEKNFEFVFNVFIKMNPAEMREFESNMIF